MKVVMTDREFQKLSLSVSDAEMDDLANDIARRGCMEPLRTWNGILIDGYKRYMVCKKYGFKFQCQEIEANSREEVVEIICRERCSGGEKHSASYRYAIGRWYVNGAILCKQEKREKWITTEIAEAIHTCTETVNQFVRYSKWLDTIDEMDHRFVDAILRGQIDLPMTEIKKLSQYKIAAYRRNKKALLEQKRIPLHVREWVRKKTEETIEVGIKEKPQFDPDAEIKSLTFTLPTWVDVLQRKMKVIKPELASEQAKANLEKALKMMQEQIDETLEAIRC